VSNIATKDVGDRGLVVAGLPKGAAKLRQTCVARASGVRVGLGDRGWRKAGGV